MDVRIAAIAGAVFLGVVTSGFLVSSADAGLASALVAPFRDSDDEHDDDEWYEDEVARSGGEQAVVPGAAVADSSTFGFGDGAWYDTHDDDNDDDRGGHDGHDDDDDHEDHDDHDDHDEDDD